MEQTFEKKIPKILRDDPSSMQFSYAFCAVSKSLVFPHPSDVSCSCQALWVRQMERKPSYSFRLGRVSEPHDCRAELSRASLKSRLHIPHAAHISETDKILPLGILRGKHSGARCPKEQACERSYQMPGSPSCTKCSDMIERKSEAIIRYTR